MFFIQILEILMEETSFHTYDSFFDKLFMMPPSWTTLIFMKDSTLA